MKWRVIIERDEETGEYAAYCPELPGCASAGVTQEEAVENIKEAIALYLEPSPVEVGPDSELLEVEVAA
ncbi:MAG: type II toxin-antitoxin system HicB family antitoxin [Dehalococcoidia bacterium]